LQIKAKEAINRKHFAQTPKIFALIFANLQTTLARSVIIKYTFAKYRLGSKTRVTAHRFVRIKQICTYPK
jgi:hypothetical protein